MKVSSFDDYFYVRIVKQETIPDKIDVEQILEILNGKIIDEGEKWMRSGVVDEAVEAAVLLDGLVNQVLDVVLARHVALDEVTLTGTFLKIIQQLF